MPDVVWVEISGVDKTPVRIYHNQKQAVASPAYELGLVQRWLRPDAVGIIRQKIFERDDFTCAHCGTSVTVNTGQMHERLWRGRGGEISLDNGVCSCNHCHSQDPVAGHGHRKVKWSVRSG